MTDVRYCGVVGDWYLTATPPLPRVRLPRWSHRCPDGTWVMVTAQHVSWTGMTLYRWTDGGERWTTTVAGQAGEPDWTAIDQQHAQRRAA